MEWKLFGGDVAEVSTREFHAGRPRAAHLEQDGHRDRLLTAARLIRTASRYPGCGESFTDLGCGDGGLLSLVKPHFQSAIGYDFCPANAEGWFERGVKAFQLDVFGDDWDQVRIGRVCALTEVLEHLTDPRSALRWVREWATLLVCSSPWSESDLVHAPEHAWAWDKDGYERLLTDSGWRIVQREFTGPYQVVLAR